MKKSLKYILIGVVAAILIATITVCIIVFTKHKHEWNDATCDTPKTCETCGDTEGEALGHKWNDATCDTPKTCETCGKTEGEALNHKWDDGEITQNATCVKEGIKIYTCIVCNKTKEESIAKNEEHKYSYEHLNSEKHKLVCECGESYNESHNFTEQVVKEATCTENGVKKLTCSDCGYNEEHLIDSHDHTWDKEAPTCESNQTCTSCGTITPKLNHEYNLKESAAATCEKDGYEVYECSHCFDIYTNITDFSTGHNVSEWELVETKENEDSCLVEYVYEGVCSQCNKPHQLCHRYDLDAFQV